MPKSAEHKPREIPLTLRQQVAQFDPWYFIYSTFPLSVITTISRGTLIFIPAIVSLLLALQWGGSKYEWKNGRIIALFVIFGVFISAFVAIQ
jgi:hypothetical protein